MPSFTLTDNKTWNFHDALIFIRSLQEEAHNCNLHLALAGSVLNKGTSDNDLDIIVMGQNNSKKSNWPGFLTTLNRFGSIIDLSHDSKYVNDCRRIFKLQLTSGLKIDLFIYRDCE